MKYHLTEYEINKRCTEIMGKTLFQGAVTKAEGEVWVRLVPYENYEPTRNIAQASEIKEEYAL